MSLLILICKYTTNQAETIKMHSVGSQEMHINTPLEKNIQVSMEYLKRSKHSRKMKGLSFV